MPTETREEFLAQRALVTGTSDRPVALDPDCESEVVAALTAFSNAADPERTRPTLRKPKSDGTLTDVGLANGSAASYLRRLRLTHQHGFDLLGGTAPEYNDFMTLMVDGDPTDPTDDGRMKRSTASQYQSAARAFYRFCTEPGVADDRPDVNVEWPADDILIFSDDSPPKHDEGDMFTDAEVNALREACLKGRNPRRDRAFLELLFGTGQRITAIRTLKVGDVYPDPADGVPYVLLNPEIRNDGDKGAIEQWGRWRPIVSDPKPIREWIDNHPLQDADLRDEHGCPDRFEDCYLFIGEIAHYETDASKPWHDTGTGKRLKRIRDATANMPQVETVTKPVDHHNFRHWGYTKSKSLPIGEDVRRVVFGWGPGSDEGDRTYGHVSGEKLARKFAEAWQEEHGDGAEDEDSVPGVTGQVVGETPMMDVSPEAARAFIKTAADDDEARKELESMVRGILADR